MLPSFPALLTNPPQQLIASADLNLTKIRKYEDYLTTKISRSCSDFLEGDLSRFGDSHEAMEMVSFARSRSSRPSPRPWGESLMTQFEGFLVSSLMLILMEIYFTPGRKEMKSYISMAHRWFLTQKRQLESFQPDEATKWELKNEVRCSASRIMTQ